MFKMKIPSMSKISRSQIQTAIQTVRKKSPEVGSYLNLDGFQKAVDRSEGKDLSSMSRSAKSQAAQIRKTGLKKILLGGALSLAGLAGSAMTGGALGVGLLALGSIGGTGLMLDTVIRDGNNASQLEDLARNSKTVVQEAYFADQLK